MEHGFARNCWLNVFKIYVSNYGKNTIQTEKLDELFICHSLILPPPVLVEILLEVNIPKPVLAISQ
ncbi:hypothetical protein BH10PSE19_BH10PSE19_05890 [soil metagenome]